MDDIRLDKDDVTVDEIVDECHDCTGGPVTHRVMVDFRSAGTVHEVGRYCHDCALKVAERIRDGLPTPEATHE